MLNLVDFIESGDAPKIGGYTGAVFLTYTLNLHFYEQIVAPALDRAGCANVVIIADQDGYAGATKIGANAINGIGLRYVCEPVQRNSGGIQHAKTLLMVGPNTGKLLIGSGNLTMHGYGHNLELYSSFDYDPEKNPAEDRYPFIQVWQLISRLAQENRLSNVAQERLQVITENVDWLQTPASTNPEFQVWHNMDVPLWEQLQKWRDQQRLAKEKLKRLEVISPYYDQNGQTLRRANDEFAPSQFNIYLSQKITNLNGERLIQKDVGKLNAAEILPKKSDGQRNLHAKAIIGHEEHGAWCLVGSANFTSPALQRTWQNGGNLELVNFYWSENKTAFDYLLNDPGIQVQPLALEKIKDTSVELSERLNHQNESLFITQLSLQNRILEGVISGDLPSQVDNATLRFLRTQETHTINIDAAGGFFLELEKPLTYAEAIRIEFDQVTTSYRWINQPTELSKHGQKAYRARIKGKIETFDGALSLFKELLDFLWDRVDPALNAEEAAKTATKSKKRSLKDEEDDENIPAPPSAEHFITEETLIQKIHWRIDNQNPYDRSTISLRDLLSMVLLRLTTETQTPESITDTAERTEALDQEKAAEEAARRVDAAEWLRNYLLNYCKKYSRRLTDPDFLSLTDVALLFQNHFTLGKVLLEFSSQADDFTEKDLEESFWLLWTPLVLPELVGIDAPSTLSNFDTKESSAAWELMSMPEMTNTIITANFSKPPDWQNGIWKKDLVKKYLALQKILLHLTDCVGNKALNMDAKKFEQEFQASAIQKWYLSDASAFIKIHEIIKSIQAYQAPASEKYAKLIALAKKHFAGKRDDKYSRLKNQIIEDGLQTELDAFLRRPRDIVAISENEEYCRKCFGQLATVAVSKLNRGELVLCTVNKDAWIYQVPQLPERVI